MSITPGGGLCVAKCNTNCTATEVEARCGNARSSARTADLRLPARQRRSVSQGRQSRLRCRMSAAGCGSSVSICSISPRCRRKPRARALVGPAAARSRTADKAPRSNSTGGLRSRAIPGAAGCFHLPPPKRSRLGRSAAAHSAAFRPAAVNAAETASFLDHTGLAAFRAERPKMRGQPCLAARHVVAVNQWLRQAEESGLDHVPLDDVADRRHERWHVAAVAPLPPARIEYLLELLGDEGDLAAAAEDGTDHAGQRHHPR